MKLSHPVLGLILAAVPAFLSAQTVNFVIVGKDHSYKQVDNSTVVEDATNPWSFHVNVEGKGLPGDNLSGLSSTPPSVLTAGGTGGTSFAYSSSDDSWYVKADYANQGLLDSHYFNGSYSVSALGDTIGSIDLTGNTYPLAPKATLSGGTISGGILLWDATQALTITISGSGIDHMGISAFGSGYDNHTDAFGVSSHSFTIAANAMTVGQSYTIEMNFDDLAGLATPNVHSSSFGLNGAKYAGVFSANTTFTIQAVPEPSTYAMIFGALALTGAMLHRRRKLA